MCVNMVKPVAEHTSVYSLLLQPDGVKLKSTREQRGPKTSRKSHEHTLTTQSSGETKRSSTKPSLRGEHEGVGQKEKKKPEDIAWTPTPRLLNKQHLEEGLLYLQEEDQNFSNQDTYPLPWLPLFACSMCSSCCSVWGVWVNPGSPGDLSVFR